MNTPLLRTAASSLRTAAARAAALARAALLVAGVALALHSQAQAQRDDALPAVVAAALAEAGLPAEALGAVVLPLTGRARAWQHRADVPMQPASTMKVLTTIVALDRLGPNLRGRTELLATGPIEGERLAGDLVLKGGADPELDQAALLHLLFQLRQRGVREITGDIVLDRTLFRPTRIDLNLPPFDEAPEWPYNMIPDALMAAGNLVGIALASGDNGTVQARLVPPLEGVDLDTRALALVDRPCPLWAEAWRTPQAMRIAQAVQALPAVHAGEGPTAAGGEGRADAQPAGAAEEPAAGDAAAQDPGGQGGQGAGPSRWRVPLRGTFPRRCEAAAALQLLDRDVIVERTVRALWLALGGTWSRPPGHVREAATPAAATLLAQRTSRPWGELMRPMNKLSDNLLSRLLFLQLGVPAMAQDGSTPTLELARRDVQRWFDEQRIGRRGLVLDNGSGLSRSERIPARALALAIRAALAGKHAPELLMSLPVAGVDGTMRRRLQGTPAEGWARLKSGALRNVRSIAGTVRDTRGDTWVLVAFVNDDEARKSWPVLDALVDWVAKAGPRNRLPGGTDEPALR